MQIKITKQQIDKLPIGKSIADTEVKGFIARRLPSGVVSFGYRYRNGRGQQRWQGLGVYGQMTPEEARTEAKKVAGQVADERDPVAEKEEGLGTVADALPEFIERYHRKEAKNRSTDEVEKIMQRLVLPQIGSLQLYELRRSDIVKMLDHIADTSGPVMADRTLAHVRKWFNWIRTRDDRFNSPIVPGMARTKGQDRARTRMLDDQEIRDLWQALDEAAGDVPPCYPAFVRALLLTAQRRTNLATMHADEIDNGIWMIPKARLKTKVDHAVPLSRPLVELLGDRLKGPFVFANDKAAKVPFSGFSKSMAVLISKIAEIRKREGRKPMPHWTLHDLRRTARSLMSRAGVPPDHAERVLAHKIPGVRGVYDVHTYLSEKTEALEQLAAMITGIVNPSPAKPRLRVVA